jgi:predicted nucleic-acid-binding Zn-ribbon protein
MESKLIKALEDTIHAKDELIKHLKEEIERLKVPMINIPWCQPVQTSPLYPLQPYTDQNPPFYVTCGTHGHIFMDLGNGYIGSRHCSRCGYAEQWSCSQTTTMTEILTVKNNSSQNI